MSFGVDRLDTFIICKKKNVSYSTRKNLEFFKIGVIYRQSEGQTGGYKDRQTDGQKDWQRDRETDGQTEWQTAYRLTDKRTWRQIKGVDHLSFVV